MNYKMQAILLFLSVFTINSNSSLIGMSWLLTQGLLKTTSRTIESKVQDFRYAMYDEEKLNTLIEAYNNKQAELEEILKCPTASVLAYALDARNINFFKKIIDLYKKFHPSLLHETLKRNLLPHEQWNALMCAATQGNKEIIEYIIKLHEEYQCLETALQHQDWKGNNTLMLSLQHCKNSADVPNLLIKAHKTQGALKRTIEFTNFEGKTCAGMIEEFPFKIELEPETKRTMPASNSNRED